MVHSCPQQRFQASLAILVGSRNGKRIDHLVTYPADNLLPVPAAAIQVGDQGGHAEDWDRAIEATSWVPDDFLAEWCAKYCIIGTASDAARKIAQLESFGVTSLYIRGFYELPAELCERFSRDVMALMPA